MTDPMLLLHWEGPTVAYHVGALWCLPLAPGLVRHLVPGHPQPAASQVAQAGPHVVGLCPPDGLQGFSQSRSRGQADQVTVLSATMFHRLLPCLIFLHQNQAALKTVEPQWIHLTVHCWLVVNFFCQCHTVVIFTCSIQREVEVRCSSPSRPLPSSFGISVETNPGTKLQLCSRACEEFFIFLLAVDWRQIGVMLSAIVSGFWPSHLCGDMNIQPKLGTEDHLEETCEGEKHESALLHVKLTSWSPSVKWCSPVEALGHFRSSRHPITLHPRLLGKYTGLHAWGQWFKLRAFKYSQIRLNREVTIPNHLPYPFRPDNG